MCRSPLGVRHISFSSDAVPVDVMFGLPLEVPPQPVHQYSKDLRARLDTAYERVRERLGWRQRRQKMVYDRNGREGRM